MTEEISCSQEVAKALCDCSETMLVVPVKERESLARIIEALSRSLEILNRIEKGGAK